MKCSFCGREIPRGTGKIIATREGDIYYICSSKCEKNMFKLKRKPQKVKWTMRYQYEKNIRSSEPKKEEKVEKKKVKKKKTTRQERRKARLEKKLAKKRKKQELKKKSKEEGKQ
ncbi:MAG: hypothetical protein J7K68_04125 [Candidatus Diapherotrites archaeon]|nr:hypothetical protein [Candidatus Diapherotrites archaeon]